MLITGYRKAVFLLFSEKLNYEITCFDTAVDRKQALEVERFMSEIIRSVDLFFARAADGLRALCGGFLTPVLKVITVSGNSGLIFIIIAAIALIFSKTRKLGFAALIALAFGALLTNVILKNVIARPRPFADVSSEFYSFWNAAGSLAESGYSFPSGHTTAAAAFGSSLFLLKNKRYSWLFLLIPVIMGFTRIYFVVHYATDVFGGFLVGAVAATAAYFIVRALSKNAKIGKFLK